MSFGDERDDGGDEGYVPARELRARGIDVPQDVKDWELVKYRVEQDLLNGRLIFIFEVMAVCEEVSVGVTFKA